MTQDEQPDPRLGERLDGFVISRAVAEGAMGRVYEGRREATGDRVAIKVLHPHVAAEPVAVERFKREYETLRKVEHPHIIRAYHQGTTPDGATYMAMEFLPGEELARVLERDGAIKPARTIRIVCQLALALERAHAAGVVHRDLKPENIFLVPTEHGDHVKVLDFGVVKIKDGKGPQLTAFGTALGSPCYMSPEQAMGKQDVDHRTDIFATAAMLHEMATGEVTFDGNSVAEIMMRIVRFQPPPAHEANSRYPSAYGAVLNKALAKKKGERYQSMRELAQAILLAFGMEGDVEGWAATPEGHIAAILAAESGSSDGLSTPPPPGSPPPPSMDEGQEPTAEACSAADSAPKPPGIERRPRSGAPEAEETQRLSLKEPRRQRSGLVFAAFVGVALAFCAAAFLAWTLMH